MEIKHPSVEIIMFRRAKVECSEFICDKCQLSETVFAGQDSFTPESPEGWIYLSNGKQQKLICHECVAGLGIFTGESDDNS